MAVNGVSKSQRLYPYPHVSAYQEGDPMHASSMRVRIRSKRQIVNGRLRMFWNALKASSAV